MHLSHLYIENLRSLSKVSLYPGPELNLIFGNNGAGKTSLLEAISILGMGRSFQGTKPGLLIQNEQSSFQVAGRLETAEGQRQLGLMRDRQGGVTARLDGEPVSALSQFARCLPVLVMGAEGLGWLAGTPARRRAFLDWGVFHILGGATDVYSRYRKALEQRNKALKDGTLSDAEISVWDGMLARDGAEIIEARQTFFNALSPVVDSVLSEMPDMPPVSLGFKAGYSHDKGTLAQALERNLPRDRLLGVTQSGPHRGDLLLETQGQPVSEVLSRGQQKVLVSSLVLAQQKLLKERRQRQVVLLVDDLAAELDETRQRQLWTQLLDESVQLFVTQVGEPKRSLAMQGLPAVEFHVKHGEVTPINKE